MTLRAALIDALTHAPYDVEDQVDALLPVVQAHIAYELRAAAVVVAEVLVERAEEAQR